MKTFIITLALILGTTFAAWAQDQITVKVDGLGCPFCAYGLEKKFKDFKAIDQIKIKMETGIFTFSYPASEKIKIQAIQAKVIEAGYTPTRVLIKREDGSQVSKDFTH